MPYSSSTDDGFREIQLNGKQLVFLFMAATVVSVVIFLCGVLVGRGVRPVTLETSEATAADVVAGDVATPPDAMSAQQAAAEPPTTEPPPTPDELSYYERLEKNGPAAETLKSPVGSASSAPPAVAAPERRPSATTAAVPLPKTPSPANAPAPEPAKAVSIDVAGAGYAVQVAALRAQGEADTIARRLSDKGYPAYVLAPQAGAPAAVYRVRVGKFKTRREADQIAARLEKEEQFKPWVLR